MIETWLIPHLQDSRTRLTQFVRSDAVIWIGLDRQYNWL